MMFVNSWQSIHYAFIIRKNTHVGRVGMIEFAQVMPASTLSTLAASCLITPSLYHLLLNIALWEWVPTKKNPIQINMISAPSGNAQRN